MVVDSLVKYAPVLKWRKGEKLALKHTDEGFKDYLLPIIELVNDEGDKPEDLSKDLQLYWGRTAYLDVHYRPSHFARTALDNVSSHTNGIDIIPVVRLDSSQIIIDGIKNVAGMYNNGYAIRIVINDNLEETLLEKEVELIGRQLTLDKKRIDLIMDFGYISSSTSQKGVIEKISKHLQLADWRRVIITAGSFPPNLLGFKPNEDNFQQRVEWDLWQNNKSIAGRDTIYGDYTVRYPENISKGGRGSKSVRFTLDDKFQVFRGLLEDATFKYLVHSLNIRTLYEGEYQSTFSWGDSFIHEKAKQLEDCLAQGIDPETFPDFSTGGSTEWVAASVNHHIAVVLSKNLNARKRFVAVRSF